MNASGKIISIKDSVTNAFNTASSQPASFLAAKPLNTRADTEEKNPVLSSLSQIPVNVLIRRLNLPLYSFDSDTTFNGYFDYNYQSDA